MIFKTYLILFILLVSFCVFGERLKIVTTVPEISWLVKQIGGGHVDVKELSSGNVDLHFLEARIDYIIKVRNADAICYGGLGLEVGWLPKVIQRSGNSELMLNQKGDCNLGDGIEPLNKPTGPVDRSMGDVHPQGNPHYTSDPLMMIKASRIVTNTLIKLSPVNRSEFEKKFVKLKQYLTKLHADISSMLKVIKNKKALSYHSEFNYWMKSYGFENLGMLEDKPGMPPSAGRIAKVAASAQENRANVIFFTDFNSHSIVEKFGRLSKVKIIKLDAHANSSDDESYRDWQMSMAKRLLSELNLKI